MSKTILNRLNKILIDRLYGTQHGRHNVDAGNKINDTFDYEAEHCLTNAQVAAELNRVYYENNNKICKVDYSLYDGGSVIKDVLTEVHFPDHYFDGYAAQTYTNTLFISMFYPGRTQSKTFANLSAVTFGKSTVGKALYLGQTFYKCAKLAFIDLSGLNVTPGSSTFFGCSSLVTLKVPEGLWPRTSAGTTDHLDLRDSPLLSLESAKDLLDKLATRTAATAATVTFNTAVYNKLKEAYPDYIENYQATKFWNIAEAEAN